MYSVRNAGGETLAQFVVLDTALARAKKESTKVPAWFAVYDGGERRAIAQAGRVHWCEACAHCDGSGMKNNPAGWGYSSRVSCEPCEGSGQILGEVWT